MKKTRIFSDAFKKEKVSLIEKGEISVSEVSELYDVSHTAVYKWLKKYGLQESERIVVEKKSEGKKNIDLNRKIASLEQLIGQMQVEKHYLECVIDCGTELIGEDLKKKYKSNPLKKPL
jgi:transposase-like protein